MMTTTITEARAYKPEDVAAVAELCNYCSQVHDLSDTYTTEDLRIEFEHPKLFPEKNLRVWQDAAHSIVGFGQLWVNEPQDGKIDAHFYFRVHPEYENTDLADEMLAWAAERMRAEGQAAGVPASFDSSARETHKEQYTALERNGFSPARYFFRMERDLRQPIAEPIFPDGYTLTHVKTDEDVTKWTDSFNLSFIDHWNFHPVKPDEHKHWQQMPDYSPDLDLVAVAPDGTFGGFCYCTIDGAENELLNQKRGWINTLGTARGHRSIGLGRALLLAGMHVLKNKGMEYALLGVDAENPSGALGFYERHGFVTKYTTIGMRKEV
jgi:mycothiol synthase